MKEILENKNDALSGEKQHLTLIEEAVEYLENFDILETITNVGNDEVFTPSNACKKILDILPKEVWSNPNYKWLNPATKNGIFEREIALRLNDGLKEVIKDEETRKKHILQNMIYSLGQTRFTSDVARRTLYYCCDANRKCDGIKEKGHYINGYAIGNGTWFDTAEGNILTPNTDHDFSSKGKKCKYCGIDEKSTYNDKNQRETYAYEFIHFDGDKILEHLQDRFFKGDRNMKFDVIIGNPPYQLSDGGGIGKASAIPIYQKFVQQAKTLNPKYISMIMPSRWMTGGKGLDEFRDEMLSDRRLIKLEDFANSKECFPNNDIKGGVCFFLWDRDYDGACHMKTHAADGTKESTRFLREGDCDIFIRDERLIGLFDKVKAKQENMLDAIVSSRNPYGISANALYNLNSKDRTFAETPFDGGGALYGLDSSKQRVKRYFDKNYSIPKENKSFNRYKVLIAKAYGCGAIGEVPSTPVLSTPVLSTPGEACTETFLEIGPFDTEMQASNVIKYIKTKFFRALVGIQKQTQNTTQRTYRFVPIQDFTTNSDINWNDNINGLDIQLFKKYKLNQEEIDFIQKNIKEMED